MDKNIPNSIEFDEFYSYCLNNKEFVSEFNRIMGISDHIVVDFIQWQKDFKSFVEMAFATLGQD